MKGWPHGSSISSSQEWRCRRCAKTSSSNSLQFASDSETTLNEVCFISVLFWTTWDHLTHGTMYGGSVKAKEDSKCSSSRELPGGENWEWVESLYSSISWMSIWIGVGWVPILRRSSGRMSFSLKSIKSGRILCWNIVRAKAIALPLRKFWRRMTEFKVGCWRDRKSVV